MNFYETGSFQSNTAAFLDAQVMQLVAMVVEKVMQHPQLDLDRMDLCALLNGEIGGMLAKARETEAGMKAQLLRTEKALKRLKRSLPKPKRRKKGEERQPPPLNMLEMVLVGRRANIDRALEKAAVEIGTMVRAQEHLAEFGYDLSDVPPMPAMRINFGPFTTATASNWS